MKTNKLFITVARGTEDLHLIRLGKPILCDDRVTEVESTHDFLVLPAYYNCRVWVKDEGGKEIYSKYIDLCPTYSIGSFIYALNSNENELDEEILDFYNNLKFDNSSVALCKQAWDNLKNADASEEGFVLDLLKGSLKGMKECGAEVGDLCDYPRFTIEYEIELPDGEEFDADKLDFFNIDCEPECWSEIRDVFAKDVIFLDTIIYDGKVYAGYTGPEKIEANSYFEQLDPETLEE